MPIVTFELPTHEIVKIEIHPDTPLCTVAQILGFKEPEQLVFFIGRYKGKIGTLMGPGFSTDPVGMFNTNECVIIYK